MSRSVAFVAIFWLFTANFVFAAEKININTASLEDLMKIVHIGEVRARELISLRPFASVDDLIKIKGIGETRIKDIKKQGLAWIGPLEAGPPTFEPQQAEPQTIKIEERPKTVNSKTEPEASKNSPTKELAAAGEQATQKSSVPLLIAGGLAVFSGAIILMLKKGLK